MTRVSIACTLLALISTGAAIAPISDLTAAAIFAAVLVAILVIWRRTFYS